MRIIIKKIIILFIIFKNLFAFNESNESSYINTKNITYNEIDNKIELGDNSLININSANIYSDRGIIDYNNNKIEIFGNLYIYQDNNILSAKNLVGNTSLTSFKVYNVSYIYNNDLKIDSNLMERVDDEIYFYDNFLTPCELNGYFNCPTWSFKIPKTLYLVSEDKFVHSNSFLQIADKKIFYVPYFSHYGNKADRKKGFLTPSLDFNIINGGTSINTPFYLPIGISSDLTLTPKFEFSSTKLETSENFEIKSNFSNKSQGGITKFEFNTRISEDDKRFYNFIDFEANNTLNKNNNLELKAYLTNSISNTRSDNVEQITYANTYVRSNSFNVFKKNDFLISEFNTITSFDESQNNLIPYIIPNVQYNNLIDLDNGFFLKNDLSLSILERGSSYNKNSKKNFGLSINNEIIQNKIIKSNFITNKLIFNNSFRKLEYDNNVSNKQYVQNNIIFSTNWEKYIYEDLIKSRLKFIINDDFNTFKNYTNEDSQSITFNYQHLFSDNRFYGFDLSDNSKRVTYGLELNKVFNKKKIDFKIGQGYDFSKNNIYLQKLNQNSKFSDMAFEVGMGIESILFKIDGRLDQKNLSKKEINYSADYNFSPFELNLIYNETSSNAFNSNSEDSKALKVNFGYKYNNNIKISTYSNMDLKNNYSPFENKTSLSFFDECSQLDISYTNTKYSDNFITVPKETIGISFKMDYLGFFSYEQNTDLFLKEKGKFYNGLNY